MFVSTSNYDYFRLEAQEKSKELSRELLAKRMKLTKAISDRNKEYQRIKDLLAQNPSLQGHYNLDDLKLGVSEAENDLEETNRLLVNLKGAYKTYDEYLKLFKSLPVKLRNNMDMDFLDKMLRLFFSNFFVLAPLSGSKQGSKVTLELKEPWSGFVKNNDFLSGRT